MTQQQEHAFPYYRSADGIRRQDFTHRMRGLDEYEVREFLDLLADQLNATEKEHEACRVENERLRAEAQRLHEEQRTSDPGEINPQAAMLSSQAQQVADQLVEEAVRSARDLMSSARNQEREILERAHEAGQNAVRMSGAVSPAGHVGGYSTPVPEVEYTRTFARVAQIQLRSVVEALAERVDKLSEVPTLAEGGSVGIHGDEQGPTLAPGSSGRERVFVYPRQRTGLDLRPHASHGEGREQSQSRPRAALPGTAEVQQAWQSVVQFPIDGRPPADLPAADRKGTPPE